MSAEVDPKQIEALARRVGRHLKGKPPQMQGAVLAELVSLWLAGHVVPGSPEQTSSLRATMLALHVETVAKLLDVIGR